MARYQVENMKCNGCVTAVKTAIEGLVNVESAEVDLTSGVVQVEGNVDSRALEDALAAIGYPAKPIE